MHASAWRSGAPAPWTRDLLPPAMREALRRILLPALQARGFDRVPLDAADARSPQIRAAFPFGRLRRRRGGGFEQIEVQFDKRSPQAFRLNFGVIPEAGIAHPVAHVGAEEAWVHHLDAWFEFYDWAWMRRWFSAGGGDRGPSTAQTGEGVAERVVGLIPAIEAALADPASARWSRHVRRVRARLL